MLFFSNIVGGQVQDEAEVEVGKVQDVVIQMTDEGFPRIFGIVIVDKKRGKSLVQTHHIETFGKNYLTLKDVFAKAAEPMPVDNKNLVFLGETVLDRQIVDMAGIRVVRVNDLHFGMVQGQMSLVALDIGKLGILRRLGLEALNVFGFLQPELLEWKNVRLLGDKIQLSMSGKELVKLHPADIANIIEKLNLNQGSELLQALDKKTAAQVLEELEPELQKILVQNLGAERAAGLMQKMSIDELADLIQMLPEYKSKEILQSLPSDSTQKVKKVLAYDQNTGGGLMTTEYVSAFMENTVCEVIEKIRQLSHLYHSIYFVYITDKKGVFNGVVSLRRLLISEPTQTMVELVGDENRITASPDQDILEIATLMTKYNFTSVAVLDANKKMLGVITVDDVMRHFVPNA